MPSKTAQTKDVQAEVPLSMLLKNLLHDDALCDVTLEGTDGESVRAHRNILAARSQVFREMFFGKNPPQQLNNSSIVPLGYDGQILTAITEYCYTDDASIFRRGCDDSMARTMVRLAGASSYFGFPGLCKKVQDWSYTQMVQEASLACAFLEEAEVVGEAAADITEYALKLIRKSPMDSLLSPAASNGTGVLLLNKSALERILKDRAMNADEFVMFRILKMWSDSNAKKKETARRLTEFIDLKHIKPSDLGSSVESSGLVSSERIAETFKAQALLLEKTDFIFARRRLPGWDISNDAHVEGREEDGVTTAFLRCDPMNSGVHRWEIEVKKIGDPFDENDEVGVAILPADASQRRIGWLSESHTGWVYVSHGEMWHADEQIGSCRPYRKGSVITFTLDLRASGSLTASLDGQTPVELFADMLQAFVGFEKPSFVPAVSLRFGTAVHFLGFHKE